MMMLLVFLSGILLDAQTEVSLKEGDPAPGFSVVTDQGKRITSTRFRGSILVVNFWHTSCRPCVTELPSLTAFARAFRRQGVVVLAVSGDEDAETYRRFLREHKVNLNTYRDPALHFSKSYGTSKFPETYLIQDGRVFRKVVGGTDWMGDEMTAFVRMRLK